jgi:hypothetical protein
MVIDGVRRTVACVGSRTSSTRTAGAGPAGAYKPGLKRWRAEPTLRPGLALLGDTPKNKKGPTTELVVALILQPIGTAGFEPATP